MKLFLFGFFIGISVSLISIAMSEHFKKSANLHNEFFNKKRTFYLIGKGGIIGVERRSYAELSKLDNDSPAYADAYYIEEAQK